jgi:hypothetical protein
MYVTGNTRNGKKCHRDVQIREHYHRPTVKGDSFHFIQSIIKQFSYCQLEYIRVYIVFQLYILGIFKNIKKFSLNNKINCLGKSIKIIV